MADEHDPKLSQHYRDLERLEPSRELDQSILATAHRAADKPHAPLVVPAGRHRWYYSLAAAAVLVFAVALTLHIAAQRRPAAQPAATAAAPAAVPEKPERWLERIAELRSRGRHAEADKELAEFRKLYPNYPLSEVMRERVEGR